MKFPIAILIFLIMSLCLVPASAQLYPANEAGVTLGAWHTIVRDVEVTKKFWALFGGIPMKIDGVDVVKIPGVLIFMHQGEPAGPSAGAVVDHVGISCQYCYFLVKRLVNAGYKTDRINPETMRGVNWKPDGEPSRAWTYAYSPDGLKIELETNPCTNGAVYPVFAPRDSLVPCPERMVGAPPPTDPAGAIGSDQLHFFLNSDLDVKGFHNFYSKNFGGRMIRYSNVNFTIPGFIGLTVVSNKAAKPRPSNKGRALDSIGFEVENLQALSRKLESAGVKFDEPFSKTRHQGYAHAAFTDQWGVPVQLTEGLAKIASAGGAAKAPELTGSAGKGKQIFDVYCSYCHSVTSREVQYADAPGLKGLFNLPPHKLANGKELVPSEKAYREVIVLGTDEFGGRMPAVGIVLTGPEMDAVIAYLKTL